MANLNLSEFTEKSFVADADHTFIWDSAASISKRVSRNSWLSGTTADFHLGLADAASPVAQTISVQSVVAGTSNTAGANLSINGSQGTGTGVGGSLLLRTAPAGSSGTAQNALVTAVAITSAGNVGIGTTSPTSNLTVAQGTAGVGTISVGAAGTTVTGVGTQFLNTFAVGQTITSAGQTLTISAIASDTSMTISPAAGAAISGQAYTLVGGTRFTVAGNGKVGIGANVFLERDGDNVLALRNGAAGQTFSVYGTYPGAAWERFTITAPTSGNVLLGTYKGTGGIARGLELQTDGVTRMTIGTNGAATFSALVEITGSSGLKLPATGYGMYWTGSTTFNNRSNGVLTISNFAENDFGRLQFGGTTASFPAIKRSTTYLQARLADDSAFAPIQGKLTTDTAYTGTVVAATGYITIYDSTGTAYRVPCAL